MLDPRPPLLACLLVASCNHGGGSSSSHGSKHDDEPAIAFAHPSAFPTPDEPGGCALANLDGKGRLDALVTTWSGAVAAYIGTKHGFVPGGVTNLSASLGRPALGDLDADGRVDAVVPLVGAGFAVLRGRGDGTFAPPEVNTVQDAARNLALADLDGDGALDVLVHRLFPGALDAWLGVGDATFVAGPSTPLPEESRAFALADWNEDGLVDGAVSVQSAGFRIDVLLGQGDGSFAKAGEIGSPNPFNLLATADLDGDAHFDLVASDDWSLAIRSFRGDGAGEFVPAATVALPHFALDLTLGDLDADGIPDLAAVVDQAQVATFAGIGGGAFVASDVLDLVGLPVAAAAGDWSGDGAVDLLAVDFTGAELVAIENEGARLAAPVNALSEVAIADALTLDWSDDGRADLVVADEIADRLVLLRGTGLGFAEHAWIPVDPASALAFDGGDVDGDGADDLVVAAVGNPSRLLLVRADGAGGFEPAVVVAQDPAGMRDVVLADATGDGHLDALVSSSVGELVVYAGDGAGAFVESASFEAGVFPGPLVAEDFNDDGVPDVAVAAATSPDPGLGELRVFLGDGAGGFPVNLLFSIPEQPVAVVATDLDGDGRPDLAVGCHGSDMTSRGVVFFRSAGGGLIVPAGTALEDVPLEGLAMADLEGDEAPDVVAFDWGTRELVIAPRAPSGAVGEPLRWPLSTSARCAVDLDFDDDGRVDLIVGSGDGGFGRVTLFRRR